MFFSVIACSEDNTEIKPLTFDNFNNTLKPNMDYTKLVEFFGEPTRDIGSGIHIYVYEMSDSTEIWIGYSDKIHYARHVDKNQQVLHTII